MQICPGRENPRQTESQTENSNVRVAVATKNILRKCFLSHTGIPLNREKVKEFIFNQPKALCLIFSCDSNSYIRVFCLSGILSAWTNLHYCPPLGITRGQKAEIWQECCLGGHLTCVKGFFEIRIFTLFLGPKTPKFRSTMLNFRNTKG